MAMSSMKWRENRENNGVAAWRNVSGERKRKRNHQ
jgi:hypothetical protein